MLDLFTAVTLSLLPAAPGALAAVLQEDARRVRPGARLDVDPQELLARVRPGRAGGAGLLDEARGRAARVLRRAEGARIAPVPLFAPRYPAALAAIPDPPLVLWVKGDLEALERRAVALVGSRAASAYAIQVAERLGAELAGRGLTVVSGLARGVDAAAHRGALEGGGPTVAVLGSGPDIIYPPEHAGLAGAVLGAGALVSERPPGAPPRKEYFPARNRVISGLSLAVVVVEAAERSGSLITARCGLEQGREVMAVPGSVLTGRYRGSHGLLRDGAKVVETVDDILEEIGGAAGPASSRPSGAVPGGPARIMAPGEEYTLDELAERSGVRPERLLAQLLELEMSGAVRRVAGGRFVRAAART